MKKTIASLRNMRKAAASYSTLPLAYSPETGEEYSANPADYFNAPEDWVMRDSAGNPMILAFKVEHYRYA